MAGESESGLIPAQCPKCGAANDLSLEECATCGIIFSRFQNQPVRPVRRRDGESKRSYGPLDLRAMGPYAHFFRRLGRMLETGMSLPQAVRAIAGSGQPGRLAAKVQPYLDQGNGLVRSLEMVRAVFPSYVWGHLAAGEHAGRLTENLATLAAEIEARRKRIMDQIFNWRMLWFFVMLFFGAASLAVTGSVGALDDGDVNKGVSGVLGAIALGSGPRFFVYILGFGGFCFGFAWFQIKGKHYLSRRFPGFESLRLNLPVTGPILIEETLVRYGSLLADLLRAGLPLYQALNLAREDIELPRWGATFSRVRDAVEKGGTLAEGFARVPRVPRDLVAEIRVGEKTGELSEGLDHFIARLKDTIANRRTTLNVITAAALFLVGVVLTLFVAIRGLTSIVSVYDKI